MSACIPKSTEWNLTESQAKTLSVLYGTGLLLFTFNFLYAFHHVVKYLVRQRKTGRLVIIFYVLVFLICVCQMTLYIVLMVDPEKEELILNNHELSALYVINCIIYVAMIEIGVIVIVTMFYVMLTVRQYMSLLTANRARIYRRVVNYTSIAFMLIVPIVVGVEPIFPTFDDFNCMQILSLTLIGVYAALLLSYTVVIGLLYSTLRQIDQFGDFSSTHKEVMAQFAVFLISFLVKLITQTVYIVLDVQNSIFLFSIIEIMQRFFLNFIPILFMLFCH